MKNLLKKIISIALCAIFTLSLCSCTADKKDLDLKSVFTDTSKVSYTREYVTLKKNKKNKTNRWRQGMVSGNGLVGYVTSGSPYSDTFIFQNMHFIMPNENQRTCPDTSDELETVKQNIISGKDITDDASYDDVYRYHPGGQLRVESERHHEKDYVSYTDYETSQTGVRYTDTDGTWERKSFTSMADGVSITELTASSSGKKATVTLSYDDISTLANFGDSDEVNLRYKKVTASDGSYLGIVAHYPDYKNSELKNGGYATVTYIVTDGKKEKISLDKKTDESQFFGENTGVKVSGADSIYLITVSDRTYDMGAYSDFDKTEEYPLVSDCVSTLSAVAKKYGTSGSFDYKTALAEHLMRRC